MKRFSIAILLAAVVLAAACTPPPPPTITPQGDDRAFVDPRLGYGGPPLDPKATRTFETAWHSFLSGDYPSATQRFNAVLEANAAYVPAQLALAAIDFREGRVDLARSAVRMIVDKLPDYTAARVYEAEIALRDGDTRRAHELYRAVAARPNAPDIARERVAQLERQIFDQLVAEARRATDEAEAARLLREAVALQPAATAARILLVQKLIAAKQWDEARRELDPLVNSADVDASDVQEALAEIEVGRGNYQAAIVRYERLARRTREPRFQQRLEEVKARWNAANMPPQFQAAVESDTVTRADFAVLLYWKVGSVRFAQNLAAPPIATDIDVAGRDEIIRAIALGIFHVDPVTRRVGPGTPLSAGTVTRLVARVLSSRGAACARQAQSDPSELVRAQRILAACGVSDPTTDAAADSSIAGATVARMLDDVDKALGR